MSENATRKFNYVMETCGRIVSVAVLGECMQHPGDLGPFLQTCGFFLGSSLNVHSQPDTASQLPPQEHCDLQRLHECI